MMIRSCAMVIDLPEEASAPAPCHEEVSEHRTLVHADHGNRRLHNLTDHAPAQVADVAAAGSADWMVFSLPRARRRPARQNGPGGRVRSGSAGVDVAAAVVCLRLPLRAHQARAGGRLVMMPACSPAKRRAGSTRRAGFGGVHPLRYDQPGEARSEARRKLDVADAAGHQGAATGRVRAIEGGAQGRREHPAGERMPPPAGHAPGQQHSVSAKHGHGLAHAPFARLWWGTCRALSVKPKFPGYDKVQQID